MYIEVAETPNKNTLKFILGFKLTDFSIECTTSDLERAEHDFAMHPLLRSMLMIQDVVSIFAYEDYISVTKSDGADWVVLKPEVLNVLVDAIITGKAYCDIDHEQENIEEFFDEGDKEIVQTIKEIIANYVVPAVAQDGGEVRFVGFRDGVVYVNLRGACSGCQMSSSTLKHGVLNMLSLYVPQVLDVQEYAKEFTIGIEDAR